jgi:uncharacterized protein YkwD
MPLATKSRPTSAHKKRQAGHHKQTKRYVKAYWPYLPMIAIVALGFMVNSLLVPSHQVLGEQTNLSTNQFLSITNQDRASYKDNQLTLNSQLDQAAQNKANDMVLSNYWSHTSPSGKTPWTFIMGSGYKFQAAGENLAYGFTSASSVLKAWMNSPDHRANILNKNYSDVGFGVAQSNNYMGKGPSTIVVAEYAEPLGANPVSSGLQTINEPSSQTISRFQSLTGSSSLTAELVITFILGIIVANLVIRHGLYWKRLVSRGELFVISHPTIDIGLVGLATLLLLLIHSAGLIG